MYVENVGRDLVGNGIYRTITEYIQEPDLISVISVFEHLMLKAI